MRPRRGNGVESSESYLSDTCRFESTLGSIDSSLLKHLPQLLGGDGDQLSRSLELEIPLVGGLLESGDLRMRRSVFRPVSSASLVNEPGADSTMIRSKARFRSERTRAKLSAEANHTFGSSAEGLYLPLAMARFRVFISS